MKCLHRPALLFILIALAVACVWVSVHPHHVAAARPAVVQAATPNPTHQFTEKMSPGMISGRVHPELIPDSAAYRLFFIVASDGGQSPTPEQAKRRDVVLFTAGLQHGTEAVQAATILANFNVQYKALIAEYNSSWAVQHGSNAGWNRFIADRDALVQLTRDQLKAALPAKAMAAFDAKVQEEKVHMNVPESEVSK